MTYINDFSAIIQARMGSKRSPGKILSKIHGRTVLGRIIERLQRCKNIKNIIIASPDSEENDVVSQYADLYDIKIYRGSEPDVMGRFIKTAHEYDVPHIVRVCADSPFILPWLIDYGIDVYSRTQVLDFMNTTCFPLGQNIELIRLSALEKAYALSDDEEKEHVTMYFDRHQDDFNCQTLNVELTVDYPNDKEELSVISKYEGII